MIEAESSSAARLSATAADESAPRMPPQAKCIRDTGLERALIVELVAKAMYAGGKVHLPVLTAKIRLSINTLREVLAFMLAEQLVEVAFRGDSDLDVYYQLTANGNLRAAEFLARSRYVGAAPVTLQAYRDMVARQSVRLPQMARTSAAELATAFAEDSLDPAVQEMLGAAFQSSRSMLLHGPSGSGKTTLARKLGLLQPGIVAIPHAILIEQDIVQLYDPAVHLAPPPQQLRLAEERRSIDQRWAICQRPLVQCGAELSADMLELRFDEAGGMYHAPAHLTANNGILLIDDLGRQRMASADLLNRFSAPLDSGADHLAMAGGRKVGVPFDLTLVLATNLAPQLLLDDASMRRIGYKIPIGALGRESYRNLFRRRCRLAGIDCDEAVLEHVIARLHPASGRALLASYPGELLSRLADFAAFAGVAPRLTVSAVDKAWASMFAGCTTGAVAPAQPPLPFFAVSGDPLLERIS